MSYSFHSGSLKIPSCAFSGAISISTLLDAVLVADLLRHGELSGDLVIVLRLGDEGA